MGSPSSHISCLKCMFLLQNFHIVANGLWPAEHTSRERAVEQTGFPFPVLCLLSLQTTSMFGCDTTKPGVYLGRTFPLTFFPCLAHTSTAISDWPDQSELESSEISVVSECPWLNPPAARTWLPLSGGHGLAWAWPSLACTT